MAVESGKAPADSTERGDKHIHGAVMAKPACSMMSGAGCEKFQRMGRVSRG